MSGINEGGWILCMPMRLFFQCLLKCFFCISANGSPNLIQDLELCLSTPRVNRSEKTRSQYQLNQGELKIRFTIKNMKNCEHNSIKSSDCVVQW